MSHFVPGPPWSHVFNVPQPLYRLDALEIQRWAWQVEVGHQD